MFDNLFDLEEMEGKDWSSKLTKRQKLALAVNVGDKWRSASSKMQRLLDDSRTAWSFYLENLPEENKYTNMKKAVRDTVTRERVQKRVRMGDITNAVETILSQQHNATFPSDDRFFDTTPIDSISEDLKESYETLLGKQFRKVNLVSELKLFKLNQILDGTACAHVFWDSRKVTKTIYEPKMIDMGMGVKIEDPLGGVVGKKKTIVEYEATAVKALNFDDWRVDPDSADIEDSYFIRRWYVPIYKLKEMYPDVEPIYACNYVDMVDHDQHSQYLKEFCGIDAYNPAIKRELEDDGKDKALLMICYDDFIIDGKVFKDHVALVLNDADILYFGKNPYNHGKKPYIVAPYEPVPGQIMGKTGVHKALPNGEFIDKVYDSASKILDWAKDPAFQISAQDYAFIKSIDADGKLKIQPGRMYPSNGGIKQIGVDVTNLAPFMQLADRCSKTIQDLTGANPILGGDSSLQKGNPATAYEVDNNVQGASSRFQVIIDDFNNRVLEPLLQMIHENNKQYKEESEYINGEEITPDLIKLLNYEFTITGMKAVMNKNRRINMLTDLTFTKMPMAAQAGLISLKPSGAVYDGIKAFDMIMKESGLSDASKLLQKIPQAEMAQMNMVNSQLPPGMPDGDIPGTDNNAAAPVPDNPNSGGY